MIFSHARLIPQHLPGVLNNTRKKHNKSASSHPPPKHTSQFLDGTRLVLPSSSSFLLFFVCACVGSFWETRDHKTPYTGRTRPTSVHLRPRRRVPTRQSGRTSRSCASCACLEAAAAVGPFFWWTCDDNGTEEEEDAVHNGSGIQEPVALLRHHTVPLTLLVVGGWWQLSTGSSARRHPRTTTGRRLTWGSSRTRSFRRSESGRG
ncbi:hypothetical protein F5X96DRAFT_453943 [Biscogniauxia mediterranea]|nr:hypothetical protein F5X96DRAFT_453943 [Biscogniauxia mediterranea]